jgi:hypothetical protein
MDLTALFRFAHATLNQNSGIHKRSLKLIMHIIIFKKSLNINKNHGLTRLRITKKKAQVSHKKKTQLTDSIYILADYATISRYNRLKQSNVSPDDGIICRNTY